MTTDEIDDKIGFLNALIAAWHKQINAIADRETNRARLGMPTDPDLTAIKKRLTEQTDTALDRIRELEDMRS